MSRFSEKTSFGYMMMGRPLFGPELESAHPNRPSFFWSTSAKIRLNWSMLEWLYLAYYSVMTACVTPNGDFGVVHYLSKSDCNITVVFVRIRPLFHISVSVSGCVSVSVSGRFQCGHPIPRFCQTNLPVFTLL